LRYFDALVRENRSLGGGYFSLELSGCGALAESQPGQFVMVRGDWERDPLLPRAFSLLSVGPDDRAAILAKTVGRGTALLERTQPGARLSILGPLGSCFPAPSPDFVDLLVGGGVGIPPVFMQAQAASAQKLSYRSEILYGGRTSQDLLLLPEIRAFGVGLFLTTDDGTKGRHGLVTAELEARLDYYNVGPTPRVTATPKTSRGSLGAEDSRGDVSANPSSGAPVRIFACGPNAMLWAVARIARDRSVPCFISVEEQMACGIGVCLGCAVPARSRPFRYACKDGPVFDAADVLDIGNQPPPATECPS
jgi:dihydroorotate dehydrogenase electron transfer subunit